MSSIAEWAPSLALVVAGVAAALATALTAFRIGSRVADMASIQLRTTVREVMQINSANECQVAAIRDGLTRLIVDPRTHPHTQLELERLLALTLERRKHV